MRGLRWYTWSAVAGMAAVVLVLAVGGWLLDSGTPGWARATGAVALPVTVGATTVLLSRRLTGTVGADLGARWLAAAGAGAAVLGALVLADRNYGLWAVAPSIVVSAAATFLPPRRQWIAIAVAAAALAVPGALVSLATDDGELPYAAAFPAGLLVFTAWVTVGPLWVWDVAERLHRARRVAAELAVADERLRFAADLHDIQGHHLQVIALKSELAERLVAADPARAAAEMAEVRRLAADALRDTRALVQGYRRTTLEDEIANATRVLAAADIDARMDVAPAPDRLSESKRHLLGLVMREATTNVLRHSRAARADVEYQIEGERARLRVSNDGAGPPGAPSGLETLAARLEAAGGELSWRYDGGRFVVAAALPVGAA
ncbi:sensor histidine kinase [Micromonospora sp. CPCC 206061]|uniref:sensor histidine kinase n=1 Tax=Micromonospora sp. CPCC 206061 TaxID=3122410 RepID=UPI002FF06AF8